MTNYLETLKEFYKQNKILVISVLAGFVVIGLILFLEGLAPKEEPTIVASEPEKLAFGPKLPPPPPATNLILAATPSATQSFLDLKKLTATIPQTARVYKFSQTSTLTLGLIDKLAVHLGFTSKPQLKENEQYYYEEGQNFLIYDAAKDGFIFGLKKAKTDAAKQETATKAQKTQELLDFLGLAFPDLEVKDTNPTVSWSGQTIFLVPRIVNGLKVSGLPFDPSLVSFNFDDLGNLVGGIFYYHLLQEGGTAYGVYPLKSVEQAWQEIQAGGGNLADLGLTGYEASYVKSIKAVSFTSVELVYRDSRERGEFLRPVYSFLGRATLNDGRTTQATYFIDALK